MLEKLKKNKLFSQIVKFGFVGVIATLIDYGGMILCKEVLGLNVLLSVAIGFTISVIANYLLSVKYVFDVDKSKSKQRNFVLFIIFSVIGLLLTELIMYLGTDILHVNYILIKILATGIVMVFNFITRKRFLEKSV